MYLESTIFNYYFDAERDGHAYAVRLFEEIKAGKYDGYTSEYAVFELKKAHEPKQSNMLALIEKYGVIVLDADDESDQLAEKYIREGVISANHRYDSSHIAVASVHGLDYKIRTKRMTELINLNEGYKGVTICTPMEVLEDD
jgi:predicted nucleic acid-binding protein